MERRSFLKKASVGAAAGALAAPAIAQSLPSINWRLASSFPKNLETIYGAGELFAKRVAALTGGKFNIRVFAAGEIVPPFEVVNAVQADTVEMCHTAGYYYVGKDTTFAFDCCLPFGLTSRQQTAWWERGGGREATRDFFRNYGIINFMGGNTGTQMGGWFRKEIRTLADLKGVKMRIPGLSGKVMERLGVVPQQLPGSDIYTALEKGTIDAAEWVGPFDDEKLGLYRIAPHYYAPGWWEPGPQLSFYINIKEFEKLPKEYQAAIETASYEAHVYMQADYDVLNPTALARLIKNGTKLRYYSKEIMDAAYKAASEIYEEEASRNAKFKKIYEPWKHFRQQQNEWFGVAEASMQNYLVSTTRR